MSSRKKTLAHLIPPLPQESIQLVEMTVRPLRLAFLIDYKATTPELLQYISYNSAIWGGRFNFFIPVHGSSIREQWWKALFEYDPDKIIICCNSTSDLEQQLAALQPFGTREWTDKVLENHRKYNFDDYGSIPLSPLLNHIYRQERPIRQSNVRVPIVASSSAFDFSVAAQFGRVSEELTAAYLDSFKAESVEFDDDDLGNYLRSFEQFRGNLSPLRMTMVDLSKQEKQSRNLLLGTAVVMFTQSTIVEDLAVFWNLRTAVGTHNLGATEVVFLPYELVRKQAGLSSLGKWIGSNFNHTNLVTLFATGPSPDELSKLAHSLKGFLGDDSIVDIWYDNFEFYHSTAAEKTVHREARVSGRQYSIPVASPKWSNRILNSFGEWVVDVDLQTSRRALEPGNGFIPPAFAGLNYFLAGEPKWILKVPQDYSLRLARGNLAIRVSTKSNVIDIDLPEDEKLILAYLQNQGFAATPSEKSGYIAGMTRLLGSYIEAEFFQDEGAQRLFEDMSQTAHGFTLGRMKNSLRREGKESSYSNEALEGFVLELARKGIFLRGYTIRCPACDLTEWYGYADIAEQMRCAGCLSDIQPPLNAPFSYRLNRLFTRGIEQGAIPVLLANLLLAHTSYASYLFVPGIEVVHGGQATDLDIVSVIDGHLVVTEAKDLRAGISDETISDLRQQLENNLLITEAIESQVFVFATMAEEIPTELEEMLEGFRVSYPNIAIHHLTGADLKRGYLKDPAKPKRRRNPHIIEWLPTSQRRTQKGRKQNPGRRFIKMGAVKISEK